MKSLMNTDSLNKYLYKLFTNKQFIEDSKLELNNPINSVIKRLSLTEEDKNHIISTIKYTLDHNVIKTHYFFLLEMRRLHIDSDFDFIPDDIIEDKIKFCNTRFSYNNPYLLIYASLFKEFKETCKTPGKMPKIAKQIHIPEDLDYHKLEHCVNEDGSYNLEGTGIYFEN